MALDTTPEPRERRWLQRHQAGRPVPIGTGFAHGSRALGCHRRGSAIDQALGADEDCSAAVPAALDGLPTPDLSAVTDRGSTHHQGLRTPTERDGRLLP